MFVYESLSDFLNEDLGSLKPFSDIPSEWKNEILRTQQGGRGGMKSKVEELSIDSDYKTFLKKFKDSDFMHYKWLVCVKFLCYFNNLYNAFFVD